MGEVMLPHHVSECKPTPAQDKNPFSFFKKKEKVFHPKKKEMCHLSVARNKMRSVGSSKTRPHKTRCGLIRAIALYANNNPGAGQTLAHAIFVSGYFYRDISYTLSQFFSR